jgi:hypothetical protein
MNGKYLYNPNSLITGAELEAGYTFENSTRQWANPSDLEAAMSGELTIKDILTKGPRHLKAQRDGANSKT